MEKSYKNLPQIVILNGDHSEITEDDPLNICESTQENNQNDVLQFHEVKNATNIIGVLPRDILNASLQEEAKRQFKCGVCCETFDQVSDFKAHAKFEHKGQEYFDCFRAKEKSGKTAEFTHEEKRQYRCEICFKTCDHANILKVHAKVHDQKMNDKCGICYETFDQVNLFKLHAKVHEAKRNYKCGICYETFDQANLFKLHAKVLKEKNDYQCGICYETFDQANLFKVHAKVHEEKMNYQCGICYETFEQANIFKLHAKVHEEKRNHKCGICYETFDQQDLFKLHADSVHNMSKGSVLYARDFSKKAIDIYNQSLGISAAKE